MRSEEEGRGPPGAPALRGRRPHRAAVAAAGGAASARADAAARRARARRRADPAAGEAIIARRAVDKSIRLYKAGYRAGLCFIRCGLD